MRPSELNANRLPTLERTDKPHPMSPRADPPISALEAESATVAVCCWHGGLIKTFGDKDRRVFFCPIGGQYWRYVKKANVVKQLIYPRGGRV
jgi:hypothetical protein